LVELYRPLSGEKEIQDFVFGPPSSSSSSSSSSSQFASSSFASPVAASIHLQNEQIFLTSEDLANNKKDFATFSSQQKSKHFSSSLWQNEHTEHQTSFGSLWVISIKGSLSNPQTHDQLTQLIRPSFLLHYLPHNSYLLSPPSFPSSSSSSTSSLDNLKTSTERETQLLSQAYKEQEQRFADLFPFSLCLHPVRLCFLL
jgi:hypothetical protein